MQLSAGARLGPYEILSAIGAGGMGEVWRARDTRLGRDVAIKVLPPQFAASEQLRARFEREAQTISSLNHPNVCTLHDVGHDGGVHYLVMELIDGESLAERLSRGPLPLAQVLRYGAEIAAALDVAHRRGIVHRDLKPGNVMITRAGAKLLDFGLAMPSESMNGAPHDATAKMPLTEEGTIVGTVQYMAPEQLEGQPADPRTDIFALGLVLYEMVAGRRAFEGRTKMSVVAAILSSEPRSIEEVAPAPLWRVIQLCLRKDREERWQSAHDVRLELESIRDAAPVQASSRSLTPWIAAAVALMMLTAAGAFFAGRAARTVPAASASRLNVVAPRNEILVDLALSPDGKTLAMTTAASRVDPPELSLRDLATGEIRRIDGTGGASKLFWSPDGQHVAFFRGAALQRVSARGGAVQTICPVKDGYGATWGPDDTIVFSQENALFRVVASGGEPQRLPYKGAHQLGWPSFLPDGKNLIVFSDGGPDAEPFIGVMPLQSTADPSLLVRATSNAVYASGRILYVKGRALLAQPFDERALRTTGAPVAVAQQIDDNDFYQYVFAASSEGTLAYRTRDVRSHLRVRDAAGKEVRTLGEAADWAGLAVSPDGTRAVAELVDEDRRNGTLWLLDLAGGNRSRLVPATAGGWQVLGAWAPDGERFAFLSSHEGRFHVYEARTNTTSLRRIRDGSCHPQTWVGDWIGCEEFSPETAAEVVLVSAANGSTVKVANTREWENSADISPDGRWISYTSDDGIIVQPVPPNGQRWTVTSGRFAGALWSADGKRLFSSDGAWIYVADVVADARGVRAGPPVPVLKNPLKLYKNRMPYGVIGNGEQFVLNEPVDDTTAGHVVLNWPALAK
jgi:serine/threonine protein kinase/Tol biopolymer transport system component